MKSILDKNKTRHRIPYIVRIILSIIFIVVIYYNEMFNVLFVPITIYLLLSIFWGFLVERFLDYIKSKPRLKIFRDSLDIIFISVFLYVTGSTYSFMIIAYISWTVGSSMNEKRYPGLYAALFSCICLIIVIVLNYTAILPIVSIYTDLPLPFSLFQALSALLVLFISSILIHNFVYSIYRKLNEEQKAVSLQNSMMENDLYAARKIQRSMIPHEIPSDKISIIYKPMEMLGGDFFDFVYFREQELLGFFICDVSGHGTSAALVTSMVKMLLLQAQKKKLDPTELLYYMNDILFYEINDFFITALYCIYNKKSKQMSYSTAGHYQPIIINKDGITRLKSRSSIPLGLFSNEELPFIEKSFTKSEVQLSEGDKVLLFTDGMIEANKKDVVKSAMFEEQLDSVLLNISSQGNQSLTSELYKSLIDFRGSENFEDDICIVCFEV